MNLRQKIAKYLTQDIPNKPMISRQEALNILNISIEEYQNLIRQRNGKAVIEKKLPTSQNNNGGPLEDFFKEVRKEYKQQKLLEKNTFKYVDEATHIKNSLDKLNYQDYIKAALSIFYADYLKKYGMKIHI